MEIDTLLAKRPADDHAYRQFVNPIAPWDRQKGEGGKAFEAFTVFRNLGPGRTRAEVARRIGHKNITTIDRWSKQFFWDHRVAEWDADQNKKVDLWKEGLKQEMVERHGKIAIRMLELVMEKLQQTDPKYLTIADVTRWVEVATKLERICKGEPDQDTEHKIADTIQIIWGGAPPPWLNPKPVKGEIVASDTDR